MEKYNFKTIPGFSNYEINPNGIVRSKKSNKFISPKKGNGKFQMIADDKRNCDRSKEQLLELVKTVKAPKEPKAAKAKSGGKPSVASQIKELYAAGKSMDEIKEKLNLTKGHYVNDVIWNINNPKKK